jgi:hypothetical protein
MICALSVITVNTSRRMRWARHVAGIGEKKNTDNILVGKPEKTRRLRRHLTEIVTESVEWINLAEDTNK